MRENHVTYARLPRQVHVHSRRVKLGFLSTRSPKSTSKRFPKKKKGTVPSLRVATSATGRCNLSQSMGASVQPRSHSTAGTTAEIAPYLSALASHYCGTILIKNRMHLLYCMESIFINRSAAISPHHHIRLFPSVSKFFHRHFSLSEMMVLQVVETQTNATRFCPCRCPPCHTSGNFSKGRYRSRQGHTLFWTTTAPSTKICGWRSGNTPVPTATG